MTISSSSLGGKEMFTVSSEKINGFVAEVNQWHMQGEENT